MHAPQLQLKIETQESYHICVIDTGRGAAVQEELHGLYARTIFRGDHQHSTSSLHDKGCEDGI
jgi:hypothetical protein